MTIIWTIVIGFVVGIIARFLTPGGPSGFFLTAALGIAGAIGATYVGEAFGIYREGQSAGFVGALVGAVVLLVVYHLVVRKKTY
ncbi:MAG TPA: GlsB/YeaQ/YmgE family stress response membrane protein [Casimicrobiaceae bacterium]|jgi:uncharacterized membrane protein YeaQ/YmgE (transglycosylase-associated protein family)|nr:GlsB/YeaQ/YmgE family stress response membrane protein [Casimicrobiaceae bacterium]